MSMTRTGGLEFYLTLVLLLSIACSGTENKAMPSEVGETGTSENSETAPETILPIHELQQEVSMTIEVNSSSLKDTGFLQTDFTCEGTDSSPHISWTGVPDGTHSIAIIAEDRFLGEIASHWVIWGIPADTLEVAAGISGSTSLPHGAVEGMNSGGEPGYSGPCPPPKIIKRGPQCKNTGFDSNPYIWNIYAINNPVSLGASASRDDLLKAIDGSIPFCASFH